MGLRSWLDRVYPPLVQVGTKPCWRCAGTGVDGNDGNTPLGCRTCDGDGVKPVYAPK